MPTGASHLNLGMGAIVFAQGAHQFATSHPRSKAALIAGGIVGGLYVASAQLINKNEGQYGHALGALTSIALSGRMGHYYYKTGILIPRGVLAGFAAAAGLYNIIKLAEYM